MAVKTQKSTLEASENKEKLSGKKGESLTKIILRRLPPTMTAAELTEQISPLPPYDYFLFVPADTSLIPWTFCRAYINLTNSEDVISFRDRFDGYVFVDNRGNEYSAIVELAPCQKIPKKKTKRDVKCGSLEDDPEYKKFVEALKNPTHVPVMSLEQRLEEIDKKDKERKETKHVKIPTPLTEFIKQKKEEKMRKKQQKEEERRKRLEWEKQMREQQEKRRLQREQERKERKANKESDQANVPPRFAAKEESKEYEKRKSGEGATKAKKSGWKDERKYDYYDDERPKYYEKPPPKRRTNTDDSQGRFMTTRPSTVKAEKTAPLTNDEPTASASTVPAKREYDDQWTKETGHYESKEHVGKKRSEAAAKAERQSKARYKDKPSVPLYQPGRKKTYDKGDYD